ncbi:hypothetical protein GIB67_031951 [Kingdonia uniflora]|uniref:Bidirectional sugar transporter SWEET n=1 Tax=Kingdonia uniflora TaxID=39325 RepID=A0A7J7NTW7_9MAGN|nr:hypothetical protein GIB67_031951 [Kingdonia uniflora]
MRMIVHFLFGILGNGIALFLFLVPAITFQRIIKTKSTEKFSCVPYIISLLTCLISAWYGLPFVSPNNLLLSTVDFTGAAIESVYVVIFIVFAPKKVRVKTLIHLAAVVIVFFGFALVSQFVIPQHYRQLFCGLTATILSICMYASPLAVMRLVMETKSVEFMPFFLSLATFLCGTFWFVFGLLGHDPFISVPNGVGCGLGALQLILYAIYRNNREVEDGTKATTTAPTPFDDDTMEKGFGKEEKTSPILNVPAAAHIIN